MQRKDTSDRYHCSFCGKPQDEVRRLIAGPGAVYIAIGALSFAKTSSAKATKDLRLYVHS